MSELHLDLENPQLSPADWQFIENDLRWFLPPATHDSINAEAPWTKDDKLYFLIAEKNQGQDVFGVIRSNAENTVSDVFTLIPEQKQILVSRGVFADIPSQLNEQYPPTAADIADVEGILSIMKERRADFDAWEEDQELGSTAAEIIEGMTVQQPEPEEQAASTTPLERYLGSVVTATTEWQAAMRKFWGI